MKDIALLVLKPYWEAINEDILKRTDELTEIKHLIQCIERGENLENIKKDAYKPWASSILRILEKEEINDY